jgi:hypothetical protein
MERKRVFGMCVCVEREREKSAFCVSSKNIIHLLTHLLYYKILLFFVFFFFFFFA